MSTSAENYYSPRTGFYRAEYSSLTTGSMRWFWKLYGPEGDVINEGRSASRKGAREDAQKVLKSAGVRVDS